ncbi:rod shape-determining protein MreC [Altericroceibacterium xinjiangense]|uniref:rod shape-determining protein MreC n=1 Tax=Altericroceibacterium xinjiangense TaxID=762261 RepID=UPI001F49CDEB|nr:rod shape-determining protein MreC [Altericroceibacterium xinjiangense]
MNKKAQLGVFAVYVIAGIGALIGAALLLVSLWRPGTFAELRGAATDVAAPVGEVGARARTGSQGVLEAISGFYRAGSRNAALQREVKLARVKLAEAEALKQENRRLKSVLGLASRGQKPVAVARLIGSTSASARRFAYISAGSGDGVRPGMPVTSPMGLVGRVLETGSRSSRVLLLTDSESMVPVRRAQGDAVAFAEGRADGSLRLRLINLGINPIEPGDVFVTSGAGGIFQPGMAVAVATQITRDGAIAQLLSNPAATDFVMIEPIWQQQAVRSLNAPPRVPAEIVDDETSAEAPVTAPAGATAPATSDQPASGQTAAEDE